MGVPSGAGSSLLPPQVIEHGLIGPRREFHDAKRLKLQPVLPTAFEQVSNHPLHAPSFLVSEQPTQARLWDVGEQVPGRDAVFIRQLGEVLLSEVDAEDIGKRYQDFHKGFHVLQIEPFQALQVKDTDAFRNILFPLYRF